MSRYAARRALLYSAPSWVFRGASLDMDFANGRGWSNRRRVDPSQLLTTTRASDAYADSAGGVWQKFTSGQPRITDRGLLVEEARTNSIRNNSMQGAVAGSPGTLPTNWFWTGTGITPEVVGVGTENGIEYVDIRFAGTTGGTSGTLSLEANSTIAATVAQVWAATAFLSVRSGSFSNISNVRILVFENNSAGTQVGFQTPATGLQATLSSTLSRYGSAVTLAQATVAFIRSGVSLTWTNGAAVDVTLRIGWPQLELGASITSPIRTTSAAATRAADAITTALAGTSEGAVVVYATTAPGALAGTFPTAWQWDDGSNNNRLAVYRDGTTGILYALSVVGGAVQAQINLGVVAANTAFKVGFSWKANDFVAVLNGGTPVTDVSGTVPSGLTVFRPATFGGGNYWNGVIAREAIFPAYRTGAQLQALTA